MKIGLAGTIALVLMVFAVGMGNRSRNLRRIEVTQNDSRQLDPTRKAKWQRDPTPVNREATALGLDQGAPGVKARLAQKQEFMREEPTTIHHPGTDEFKVWYTRNQRDLPALPRISFRQLCFSFAREGEGAQDIAARSFRKVSGEPVDSDAGVASLADHRVLQSYFRDRTPAQVAKIFGAMFARTVFQLKPGSWQLPLESELGWHLVWIDSITSGPVSTVARSPAPPGNQGE